MIDPELSEASQWLRSKESACQCGRRGFDSDQAYSAELTSVEGEPWHAPIPLHSKLQLLLGGWKLGVCCCEEPGALWGGCRGHSRRGLPTCGGGVTLGREGSAAALSRLLLELTPPAVRLCAACVCRSHRKCCNPVIPVLSRPGV